MAKCPVCDRENPDDNKFCKECGANLSGGSQTGQLNRDTVLENRYIIVKTLGQGGMGAVYLALDSRLNNIPVAIKEMSTRAVGGDLQAAIAAFKKEAAMLLGLHHHSLPVVRDFFAKGEERWYLVMDFVEGQSLAEIAHNREPIPEVEVLDWARQLCEILDYLHKQNPPIIFRDLKPANIMLTPQGQIKLIDFGIARHFRQGNTADTTAYGSHGFAPPEQYGENQTSPSSDIYALGATLHYLLTGIDPGKNPFLFDPPSKTVKVSSAFETAIMKALELRAEDRPNNMQEILALLPGGLENSVAKNVGKKQDAESTKSKAVKNMPAQELKTAPISNPVDVNMAEGITASLAGGVESNTIPMDPAQTKNSKTENRSFNSVSSAGGQPDKKPNKTRNMIITICLLITMISGGIFAYIQSTKDQFKVGLECSYAPFNWSQINDSDGAVAISSSKEFAGGYDVEIAKKIADGLGRELVIVKTSWCDLIPAVQSGTIDAIIAGMVPTAERKNTINFTDNYYKPDLVMVVKKGSPYEKAKSIQDFSGAKVTAQLDTFSYTVIDQIKGVKKQIAMDEFGAMREALESGIIDGYISYRPEGISASATNPKFAMVEFTPGQGFRDDAAVAVGLKKGNPDIARINEILAGISEADRKSMMDKAISGYYGEEVVFKDFEM